MSKRTVWEPIAGVDPDTSGDLGVATIEFVIGDDGRYVCEDMAAGLALCRQVAAAPSVPDDVRATLELLLRFGRVDGDELRNARIDAALAWLAEQEAQADE